MLKLQNRIRWVSLGQIMGRFTMIYCLMPGNPGIRREINVQSPNPPIMFLYVSVMFCGLKSEENSTTMLPHHAPSSKSKLRNAFNPQTTLSWTNACLTESPFYMYNYEWHTTCYYMLLHVITCYYMLLQFFCCTTINIHHCPPRIPPSQRQLGLASSGTIRHWHMVEVAVLSPRNINDNQCPWPEISSDIHGHRYDMIWWYVT